ncbi:MAG TPA: hypothetical protein VM687_10035, partial [Stenotrophomonas sp.]|nr:hypothetical protein [Stenotrophomonas sp.]
KKSAGTAFGAYNDPNWRMQGVSDAPQQMGVRRFETKLNPAFNDLGIVSGYNSLARRYNAQVANNVQAAAGLKLPLSDTTLGETGFGARLLGSAPHLPRSSELLGIIAPNLAAWGESGAPVDLTGFGLGQFKASLNFGMSMQAGILNAEPLYKLGYLATGLRFEAPQIPILRNELAGGASFDVGLALATAFVPELRVAELEGSLGGVAARAGAFNGDAVAISRVSSSLEPEFDIFFRGDATDRSRYLSGVAMKEGVDASNALITGAENSGTVSSLFGRHGIGSSESPFISVSSAEEVALHFASGSAGNQQGYVSMFRLPKGLAQPNIESMMDRPWEREWLVPTEIDSNYLIRKYQVERGSP